MKLKMIGQSLLGLSLMAAPLALAQPERMEMREHRVERMVEALDLSDDQRVQVERIGEAIREKSQPIYEQLSALRAQSEGLVDASRFDRNEALVISGQVAELRAELMLLRLESRHEIRSVLSEAQRAALDDLKSRRVRTKGR